ncbi:MAG: FAD-dependent oxidoreductase [Anaerolineae bacterium]
MALGQAAGVAAALASRSGVTPRALPVAQVQQALEEMGVRLAPPEAAV